MNITKITVRAERCFNHPHESYSNLRPALEMTASLSPDENADEAVRSLQAKAETMIEQHKTTMLEQIEKLWRTQELTEELRQMESTMQRAQEKYAELKKEQAELGGNDLFKLA